MLKTYELRLLGSMELREWSPAGLRVWTKEHDEVMFHYYTAKIWKYIVCSLLQVLLMFHGLIFI